MKRHAFAVLTVVLLAGGRPGAFGQQKFDPDFDTSVAKPTYTDKNPSIIYDNGHFNFYWATERYKPLVDMLINDGYRVRVSFEKFTPEFLKPHDILLISGAMGAKLTELPDASKPAFTERECDVVHDWVEAGGRLLLVTSRPPFGSPSAQLASRFGVKMSKCILSDPMNSLPGQPRYLVYSIENGLLGNHLILQGRDESERVKTVFTFAGQSLEGPRGSTKLLVLSNSALNITDSDPGGESGPAEGQAQGLAIRLGKGKVVVLGEAAIISAQFGRDGKPMGMNTPGNDNRQFALNIMHWLSDLIPGNDVPAERPGRAKLAVGARKGKGAPARVPQPERAKVADRDAPKLAAADLPREPLPDANRGALAGRPANSPPVHPILSAADIGAESEPSVARIEGKSSFGSAFVVGDGVLVTNARTIADEFLPNLIVRFPSAPDDKQGPYETDLLYEDPKQDLAYLVVKTKLPPLRAVATYPYRKGDVVTVIGNASAADRIVFKNSINQGAMNSKTSFGGQPLYQLTLALKAGHAGGPVFDSTGQVIGVVTLKGSKHEAPTLVIPVEVLQSTLARAVTQPPVEIERSRARHHAATIVQGLSSAGAIYCIGIDLRRAVAALVGTSQAGAKATSENVEAAIAMLEKDTFPELTSESGTIPADSNLARSFRDKVGQLVASFENLKAAHGQPLTNLGDEARKSLRNRHRQLVVELNGMLKLDTPPALLSAFEDHLMPQPSVIAIVPTRASLLRQHPPGQ